MNWEFSLKLIKKIYIFKIQKYKSSLGSHHDIQYIFAINII